jgi:Lar family restriction alleviation protein
MAKTVKLWVFVRDDGKYGEVRPIPPEGPSVWGGAWVEMIGELPDPEPPPLLPCPFCGDAARYPEHASDVWFIECVRCGATGARRDTKADAVSSWNYRANDWPRQVSPGPDRELTLLDGTVYRKVGSNGMNAYEELDRLGKERNAAWERMLRAQKLVSEVREMLAHADTQWLDLTKKLDALDSILSHRPESRTPV